MRAEIRQIFYDAASRRQLDPGFLPLDNTRNPRPDWFEFGVIRDFLLRASLQEDTWYGFLSPKFGLKTGLDSAGVNAFLRGCDARADVALFSTAWDQISFFLNPFEQGEFWHPGMADVSQEYLAQCGVDLDVRRYVSHTGNTVYSNFVVARPAFWRDWLVLADKLFELAEEGSTDLGRALGRNTSYGAAQASYQMKAFLQERLAPIVLAAGTHRVAACDLSDRIPLFDTVFRDDGRTRNLLKACDTLKMKYAPGQGQGRGSLDMFRKMRSAIPLAMPMPTPFV